MREWRGEGEEEEVEEEGGEGRMWRRKWRKEEVEAKEVEELGWEGRMWGREREGGGAGEWSEGGGRKTF